MQATVYASPGQPERLTIELGKATVKYVQVGNQQKLLKDEFSMFTLDPAAQIKNYARGPEAIVSVCDDLASRIVNLGTTNRAAKSELQGKTAELIRQFLSSQYTSSIGDEVKLFQHPGNDAKNILGLYFPAHGFALNFSYNGLDDKLLVNVPKIPQEVGFSNSAEYLTRVKGIFSGATDAQNGGSNYLDRQIIETIKSTGRTIQESEGQLKSASMDLLKSVYGILTSGKDRRHHIMLTREFSL